MLLPLVIVPLIYNLAPYSTQKTPKPISSVCSIYRITSSPTLSSESRQIIHLMKEGMNHFGHFRMCTLKNFQILHIHTETRSGDKAVIYNISDCNPEANKIDAFKDWKENSQRKCMNLQSLPQWRYSRTLWSQPCALCSGWLDQANHCGPFLTDSIWDSGILSAWDKRGLPDHWFIGRIV